MDDEQGLIDEFIELSKRLRLRDVDVAAASGISAPTVHTIRTRREVPKHPRCIEAIRRFVERNRNVAERGDVRLAS